MSLPLLISIPKAGTHLLTQAHQNFTHDNLPYGSMIYAEYPHELTISGLNTMDKYSRTHIAYHPIYEKIIREKKYKAVFLYRDPRDLMVSYYYWIVKLNDRGCSIPGLIESVGHLLDSDDPYMEMIPFWGAHIRRYIPWMFVPGMCSVSYEELMIARIPTLERLREFWNWSGFASVGQMQGDI